MRDMDYPKPRGATNADLLDLGRADATLRDAATLWISDYLDLYENGKRLPAAAGGGRARLAAVRQVVRVVRRGARAPDRAAAAARHRVLLEPGAARRAVRVPDSRRTSRASRSSRAWRASASAR